MTERVGYWREYFLGKLKIYSGELLKGKIMANYNVYFSPTGTTERVVKHMGESFGSMENIDLSRRDMKWNRGIFVLWEFRPSEDVFRELRPRDFGK